MKKTLLGMITLTILILPSLAAAASVKTGAYASGFLGVSLLNDTDVTSTEIDNGSLNTYNDRIEFEPGVYVGGTAGYDFGIIRLEGELSYKKNEMDTLKEQGNVYTYFGVDGDIGAFAVMANGFIDFHNSSPITPYFGGGIGLATLYVSETYGTDIDGYRSRLYAEDKETVFAYQAGAGLDIALNSQTSLDIGYRFFETEKANFNSDWLQSKSLRFQSHNVAVAFRFSF